MKPPYREQPARVAVIGARGIGKYHAYWWALEGARVCAVAGTSGPSVEEAVKGLRALFTFEGRGYADVRAMIEAERPAIVDVCSPPHLHVEHVALALEAGCHVLCEKPFVLDRRQPRRAVMRAARRLARLAESKGLLLSVSTQYAAAARALEGLWKQAAPKQPLVYFKGHVASPARGREANPGRVWLDLAPHPLSALVYLARGGGIDWDSLGIHFDGHHARALFTINRRGGPPIECDIVVGNTVEKPFHVRFFQLNDCPFNIEGEDDPREGYRARITTPQGFFTKPDFLRLVIRDFVNGMPTVSVRDCVKSLDIMLRIHEAASLQGAESIPT